MPAALVSFSVGTLALAAVVVLSGKAGGLSSTFDVSWYYLLGGFLGALYVLNALILTTGSYLLMHWNIIRRPFINVPWTTPPIVGPYLVTGGDWRAAIWGALSIVIAAAVYFPFARAAERQRSHVTS